MANTGHTLRAARLVLSSVVAAALVLAAPWLPAQAPSSGKTHPRLVSAQAARCSTCHEQLTAGKAVAHPATEDCTACHDVAVSEAGTRITVKETGPGLCLACHDALEAAAQGKLKSPHAPVTDACTNCHSPHASDAPHLLKAAARELCAGCHALADLQAAHGSQLTDKTECTSCHLPHGSSNPRLLAGSKLHAPFADKSCVACHRPLVAGRTRLTARGNELCTGCHGDLARPAPAGGSLHAALQPVRGLPGCLGCHAPHMSGNARLLLAGGPQACARCHAAVVSVAQAPTGHAPAREDCGGCHQPHSSAQPKLLADAPAALCAGCHDPADATLRKAHLGADLSKLDCLACHSPHGAGQKKLLARNVHPPVLDGCDSCHEGRFDKLGSGGPPALCLACHGDVGEKAEKSKVPHAALQMAGCTECHNPHASGQRALVKSSGAGPCAACHEDQVADAGEFAHGAVTILGCGGCHEPHGGDQPRMLRQSGNALCLACHDARNHKIDPKTPGVVRVMDRLDLTPAQAKSLSTLRLSPDGTRNHPVPRHLTIGTPDPKEVARRGIKFEGEMGCLTCHEPHKGASRQLLRWGVRSSTEACARCHQK